MLEREALRRYRWELALVMVLYIATLIGATRLAKGVEEDGIRTLLLLVPAIPVFLAVWVIARQFRRMDEFVRLRSLESIAVAAAVTAGLSFTYGFLESAGFPRLSMFWVWGVMGGAWGAHTLLRCWFAR
jgi:hypothetical protein